MMMMIINILMVCVWVTQGSLAPTLEADPSTGGLTLTIDKDETAALWIKLVRKKIAAKFNKGSFLII